jgi:hypothetical protein
MAATRAFDAQMSALRKALAEYHQSVLLALSPDERVKVGICLDTPQSSLKADLLDKGKRALKSLQEIKPMEKIISEWQVGKQSEADIAKAQKAFQELDVPASLKTAASDKAQSVMAALLEVKPPPPVSGASVLLASIVFNPENGKDPFNLRKHPKTASDHFVELGAADVGIRDVCKFLSENVENAKHTAKFFIRNPGSGNGNFRRKLLKYPNLLLEFIKTPGPIGDSIRDGLVAANLEKSKFMEGLDSKTREEFDKVLGPRIERKDRADKFNRIREVFQTSVNPFDVMLNGTAGFDRIAGVTFKDVVAFLKDRANAGNSEYAESFFQKQTGAGTFSFLPNVVNWRKEAAKNPDALRDLIINGGDVVRAAIIESKLLQSSHMKPEMQSEMKVLMKLMGGKVEPTPEDFQRFNARSQIAETTDAKKPGMTRSIHHVSDQLQKHLERCLVEEKADQVKSILKKLANDKDFEPLAKDLMRNLNGRDSKFVMRFLNVLAEMKDPSVNKFIMDHFGGMKNFPELSRHPDMGDELKGLVKQMYQANITQHKVESFEMMEAPVRVAGRKSDKEEKPAEEPPKSPRPG